MNIPLDRGEESLFFFADKEQRGAQAQDSTVLFKDRLVKTACFTVGIDPQKFDETISKPEVGKRIDELTEHYKGKKVVLGVDRLDYIKGLVHKLHGFEEFLQQYPEWIGKIVLIQVAVPSREDVKEYQELETEISCCVGKINGKYSTLFLSPTLCVGSCNAHTIMNRHSRVHAHRLPSSLRPLPGALRALQRRRRLSLDLDARRHEPSCL